MLVSLFALSWHGFCYFLNIISFYFRNIWQRCSHGWKCFGRLSVEFSLGYSRAYDSEDSCFLIFRHLVGLEHVCNAELLFTLIILKFIQDVSPVTKLLLSLGQFGFQLAQSIFQFAIWRAFLFFGHGYFIYEISSHVDVQTIPETVVIWNSLAEHRGRIALEPNSVSKSFIAHEVHWLSKISLFRRTLMIYILIERVAVHKILENNKYIHIKCYFRLNIFKIRHQNGNIIFGNVFILLVNPKKT